MNDSYSVGPNEILFEAVQSNDLGLFKQILKIGLEISTIDLNRKNFETYEGLCILDFCCMLKGRSGFVKIILAIGVDVNVLNVWHCKAPIHLAAENGCEETLKLLLEHGKIDVNIRDSGGNSALHLAASSGQVECARLLLRSKYVKPNRRNSEGETAAYVAATSDTKCDELMLAFVECPKVNLDVIVRKRPLRQVVFERYPHLEELQMTALSLRSQNVPEHTDPFTYLYLNDAEGFISRVMSTRRFDRNNGEYTYLQYACISGMTNVVQVLFDCGVNPNATVRPQDYPPIFFAAHRGFADIVRLFLARSSFYLDGKRRSMVYQTASNTVLHQVILGSNNDKIANNASCDHYQSFLMLLQFSRYNPLALDVNRQDRLGNTCLHLAAQRDARKYVYSLLDFGAFIGKRDVKGITALSNISDSTLESYLNRCVKHNDVSPNDPSHEIIFSYKFLCPPKVLKLKRNDKCLQRTLESQKFVHEDIPETDILMSISEVPELRRLLLHPLLTSFLYLKWMKIRMFYYLNCLIYSGFLCVLSFYVYSNNIKNKAKKESKSLEVGVLNFLLWIYLVFFFARELFQYNYTRVNYVKSLENWIEITIIILTLCLLCNESDEPFTVSVSAVLILVSWTQLTLIIGQEPRMAVQVEMFKVVSINVLKTLLWYWMILFAFIQSFYVLFNHDNKFSDFYLATFKIIIMLTGEFDSSSLPFRSHPIVGRLLFILFLFLIPVVLVNLLNGLAVSDIQAIKSDAEIIAQVSRIKFINFYETIAVGNVFLRIRKSRVCVTNNACRICSAIIYLFGVINLKLFRDEREQFEISVLTNEKNAILFGTFFNQTRRHMRFRWKNLDADIVKKTMRIFELNSESPSDSCAGVHKEYSTVIE